jgi:O-antigen ligase
LFFWLIWEFAPTLKEQNRLLHAFIFGLTATLVMLYYGFAFDPGGVGQALVRYGGGGLNLNRQAVMLVMSILLALNFGAALAFEQSRWRTFYWLYVPAAVVAVPLTGSRQGFVCLLVAGAASLPLLRRAPWWSKLLLAIIAIGAVLAIVRTTPQILMERIASPEEYDPETGALGGRRVLWERGLEVLAEKNLLTGIGAGTYSSATATGTRIIAVAHNVFVGVLVETGIIGLILYTTMLAMLARQVWKIANEERLLWITMLSIWGLAALVGSSEYEKFTWFLFGIVTARCAALPQRAMGAKNATIPATNVIPTANLRPAGFPRKR